MRQRSSHAGDAVAFRKKNSRSHHSDGDIAAHFPNTCGYHSHRCSEIRPPIDDPPTPACSGPVSVRYVESMNGFTSSTRKRP